MLNQQGIRSWSLTSKVARHAVHKCSLLFHRRFKKHFLVSAEMKNTKIACGTPADWVSYGKKKRSLRDVSDCSVRKTWRKSCVPQTMWRAADYLFRCLALLVIAANNQWFSWFSLSSSLRGRRLKGKGKEVLWKEVLGARETRGACEEGGRETPARKPLFFSFLTSTRRMLKSWLVKIW